MMSSFESVAARPLAAVVASLRKQAARDCVAALARGLEPPAGLLALALTHIDHDALLQLAADARLDIQLHQAAADARV